MSKTQRVADKVLLAADLATVGSAVGPVGTIGGAIAGLLIGDDPIVVPIDMIAIPAYQYSALVGSGVPAFSIYIKEGEVLTQVMATEAEEAAEAMAMASMEAAPTKKRKTTAYQRKYKAAFKKVKSKHKKKDGQWKKGGFKAAVKAAHKIAGGKK
jgi:hypothetical protein